MRDLNFKRHQYCIFHFKLGINKLIRDYLRNLRMEQTQIMEKRYKNHSKKFIEDELKRLLKKKKEKYVTLWKYYTIYLKNELILKHYPMLN